MTDDKKINANFLIIDNDDLLDKMINACMSQSCIALDTEFIRTDTFYPKPALIQIYDGQQIYLVDPLKIKNIMPLKELLLAPTLIKVMHSCSEDMDVFSCLLDCYPQPLIDTQVAANLIGHDFSISYQRLIEVTLGEVLDKTETRSNWLNRPLSAQQLQYAANDVFWLLDAYHALIENLQKLGRLTWLQQDCEALVNRHEVGLDFDQYYLKIKSAWRLSRSELNVFKSLCAWRESSARQQNRPRGRILSDGTMLTLARHRPKTVHDLSQVKDINPAVNRKYGEQILSIISLANDCPEAEYPPPMFNGNSLRVKQSLKEMKSVVASTATTLGVQEAVIASRKDMESYLFSAAPSNETLGRGWRGKILSAALHKIADNYRQSQV